MPTIHETIKSDHELHGEFLETPANTEGASDEGGSIGAAFEERKKTERGLVDQKAADSMEH